MKTGLILLGSISIFLLCGCGATQPVYNIDKQPIIAMKNKSIENVQAAIIEAGKRIGWTMSVQSANHIIATLDYEDHMAKVDIYFDSDIYSIKYNDSANMKYDDGQIHNRYNRWILKLDKDIRHMFTQR